MNLESLLKKINVDKLPIPTDYYQYQGFNVPRVTEILSAMLHEDYLMTWANSIGLYQRKKYKEEIDKAATKGAYTHNAIEDFIQNGNDLNIDNVEYNYQLEVNYAYGSFKQWWDIISTHSYEVIMQEEMLKLVIIVKTSQKASHFAAKSRGKSREFAADWILILNRTCFEDFRGAIKSRISTRRACVASCGRVIFSCGDKSVFRQNKHKDITSDLVWTSVSVQIDSECQRRVRKIFRNTENCFDVTAVNVHRDKSSVSQNKRNVISSDT